MCGRAWLFLLERVGRDGWMDSHGDARFLLERVGRDVRA